MQLNIISFFFGIVSALYGPIEMTIILMAVCLFLFITHLFKLSYRRSALLVSFLAGISLCFYILENNEKLITQLIFYQEIQVLGFISSIPNVKATHTTFDFLTTKICQTNSCKSLQAKLRLSWYGYPPQLKVGQQWQLAVRLKTLRNFANPGSMNYVAKLQQENIIALGQVIKAHQAKQLNHFSAYFVVDRVRQLIMQGINDALPNAVRKGVLHALTIGDESSISFEDWQILSKTGTSHLVSISGLHLGFISAFIFFLINYIWRMNQSLILIMPSRKAAALFSIIFAVLYTLLAGFSIPVQRSLIMLIVSMLAYYWHREIHATQLLLIALFIILALNPLGLMSYGFWLSFIGVAFIFYALFGRLQAKKSLQQWAWLQFIIFIGLMPITLFLFQQISVISTLANAIAVPWVNLSIVPLCLLASLVYFIFPSVAYFCWLIAHKLLEWLWIILSWLADFAYSDTLGYFFSPWQFAWVSIGAVIFLLPLGMPGRWLGLIWIIIAFMLKPARPEINEAWFTLLDVGQGLASVIQTQNHTLLYDTGPGFSEAFDTGRAVVIPYLRTQGIQQVDKLIISHNDNDHSGGAYSLMASFPQMTVYASDNKKFAQQNIILCQQGQQWEWDGVKFEILFPRKEYELASKNNRSCVLRITVGSYHILLPGDIEILTEQILVKETAQQLKADILVAPHHGSKTSSSQLFIYKVKPHYVLFSVGHMNRYRLPKKFIVQRYRQIGSNIYSTVESGALTFKINPYQAIQPPTEYRNEMKKYFFYN